ncbi:hypothetical protein C9413_02620 [Rhizobium sp. SEMIA 4085]|uniref:hypothetical protein n=1 Tax=Rhizobium TaxID=379 RepID=UPI001479500B|nr:MULTISPECIES: hypothetical protein [Rhizobium]NNH28435.1 hypothetical protein [Rhizobium sp. SEMIA 4085]
MSSANRGSDRPPLRAASRLRPADSAALTEKATIMAGGAGLRPFVANSASASASFHPIVNPFGAHD